jgi:chemotaxis signal transduction protein
MQRKESPQDGPPDARPTERALSFRIGNEHYAIALEQIEGLADHAAIHEVPGAPRSIRGLAEWRGTVLTVIDLAYLLDHDAVDGETCLIRLAHPIEQTALLTPAAIRTVSICPTTDDAYDRSGGNALSGRLHVEGRTLRLIDPVVLVRLAENASMERG